MPTEYPRNPNPHERDESNDARTRVWTVPAIIAAVILLAATLIFSSAAPDRTRTTENLTNPNASEQSAPKTQPPAAGIR
jgi:hypothetical protein